MINFSNPYIIAEINTSHFGDLDLARKMIKSAKVCGANCVKFQSWSETSLYSKSYYNENPIAKRFISKFSLNQQELKELSVYCKSIEIDFASTPYSIDEVDFLIDECEVPFIKVASMDINNFNLLKHIAKRNIQVILSTGMSDFNEIISAVHLLESTGLNKIVILHCNSLYPTKYNEVNLKNLITLANEFPKHTIGFSDHTIGIETAIASIALGAKIVEKHFTLDSSKIGMDNQMATEPELFEKMVNSCKNVHDSLGGFERIVNEKELDQRQKMRRSIIAKVYIKKGEVITNNHLSAKRPGTGIPLDEWDKILGKTAKVDIEEDCLIYPEYLND